MEGVLRIEYNPELNLFHDYELTKKSKDFWLNFPLERVVSPIEAILDSVETEDESEVILSTFIMSSRHLLRDYEDVPNNACLMIAPIYGKVRRFNLNPNSFFFSNTHMNVDPTIIYRIKAGFHFDKDRTDDYIWNGGFGEIPNRVGGAFLFKCPLGETKGQYPFYELLLKEHKRMMKEGAKLRR